MTVTLALTAGSRDARAQAWVDEAKSLDVGLNYNLGLSDKVLGPGSIEYTNGGTTSQELALSAEYTPIEKLAVAVSLPLVMLKYTGDKTMYPHPNGGSYDDGTYHTTLTDLRFGGRYQVYDGVVAISPNLGVTIPVADYETVGNTVAGRHLKQLHLGVSIGKVFLESAYVHATYEFSLAEKYDVVAETEGYSQNHSDATLSAGYQFLDGKLDVNLATNMRFQHDGVDLDFATLTPMEAAYHDPILKEKIILVGGGVGYQVTDQIGVSLAARLFAAGNNTQNASVFGLGVSWSPKL